MHRNLRFRLIVFFLVLLLITISINFSNTTFQEKTQDSLPKNSAYPNYYWGLEPSSSITLAEGIEYIPNWTAIYSASFTPSQFELKIVQYNDTKWINPSIINTGSFSNNTKIAHGWNASNLEPGKYNLSISLDFVTNENLLESSLIIFILNKTVVTNDCTHLLLFQNALFEVRVSFNCPGYNVELLYLFSEELIFETGSLKDTFENYTLYFNILVNNSEAIMPNSINLTIYYDDGIIDMLEQFSTLFNWIEVRSEWEPLTGSSIKVDWAANELRMLLEHFSIYAFGKYIPKIEEEKKEDDEEEDPLMVTIPYGMIFIFFIVITILFLVLRIKQNLFL